MEASIPKDVERGIDAGVDSMTLSIIGFVKIDTVYRPNVTRFCRDTREEQSMRGAVDEKSSR